MIGISYIQDFFGQRYIRVTGCHWIYERTYMILDVHLWCQLRCQLMVRMGVLHVS